MPTLNFSGLLAILTAGAVLVLSFTGEPPSSSASEDNSIAATAPATSTTAAAHREASPPARSRGA